MLNHNSKLLFATLTIASQVHATGQWSVTGSMNIARKYHTATLLPNGKVLVAGGFHNASAELYDPSTGTWSNTGSMSTKRSGTATLLPNGKVLVAGGSDNASAELYDPSTGTWSNTGSMNTVRSGHTATLLLNGKVLIAGDGVTAELYDPSTGTWSNTAAMYKERSNHTATLLTNGKVLVAGGFYTASAELYNPSTGTWSNSGTLLSSSYYFAIYAHTATLLPNGKVLVAGGFDNGFTIARAELYDPSIDNWSDTGGLATGRHVHTATLLPNGKVLVVGGNNIASGELYDPSTGNWSYVGTMIAARQYHTATLLPNGKVLVAGGSVDLNALASAELYDPGDTIPTETKAALESPQQNSYESGIGLIRGWACEANKVEFQIDDGVMRDIPYGSNRGDTEPVCGDKNNGFGFTFNWNSLTNGTHTIKLFIDGTEVATANFTTTNLGTSYLQGASGECEVSDFPEFGDTTNLRWSEPHQNFVIVP